MSALAIEARIRELTGAPMETDRRRLHYAQLRLAANFNAMVISPCLASRLGHDPGACDREDRGCGAIARDRANPGNERSGASRRAETIGESVRTGKETGPFFTGPLTALQATCTPRSSIPRWSPSTWQTPSGTVVRLLGPAVGARWR